MDAFKQKKLLIPIIICFLLISSEAINAQSALGIRQVNIWGDLAFASPEKALKGPYSDGNAMQLYYGADIPFAFIEYNKKQNIGLSLAAFLGYEKANFSNSVGDGLDVKLTSYGIRLKPFAQKNLDPKKLHTNLSGKGLDEDLVPTINLFKYIFTGLYIDFGMSSASLIEPPFANVQRNPKVSGYGLAPMVMIHDKIGIGMDLGIRKYNWTNASNTISSIKSIHMGFGLNIHL